MYLIASFSTWPRLSSEISYSPLKVATKCLSCLSLKRLTVNKLGNFLKEVWHHLFQLKVDFSLKAKINFFATTSSERHFSMASISCVWSNLQLLLPCLDLALKISRMQLKKNLTTVLLPLSNILIPLFWNSEFITLAASLAPITEGSRGSEGEGEGGGEQAARPSSSARRGGCSNLISVSKATSLSTTSSGTFSMKSFSSGRPRG
mmetsp:Transcript_48560/g.126011  ORF Transcript_48560/g.126011 Transcript_48560/m.126011 type:complete len:205 (-) Transcript_48560:467-1081(-)